MVLLPNAEDTRRQREKEKARHTQRLLIRNGIAGAALLVVGSALIVLIVRNQVGPTPDTNAPLSNQEALARRLASVVNQNVDEVVPKTIEVMRAKLAKGNFDVLAVPDTRSVKPNGAVSFKMYIVRSNGFNETVSLNVTGVPTTMTSTWSSATVPPSGESTELRITVKENAAIGIYPFTVTVTSGTQSKTVTVQLIVSNFAASAIHAQKVSLMDQGTKWQATITWETNVAANSWVEYTPQQSYIDERQAYAYTTTSSESAPRHSLTLYYLEPDTVYHYRIKSVDASNSVLVSQDQFFVTRKTL